MGRWKLLAAKFIALEDFDVVDKGDHGVFFEVIFGDMFDDLVRDFRSGDDFDFSVAGFGVAWANAARALAADGVTRVTGGAHGLNFGEQALLDGLIANYHDAFHLG